MDQAEGRKRGGTLGGKLSSSSQPRPNTCFFLNMLIWILYISREIVYCVRERFLNMNVYEACQYMSYKMTKELLVKRMRDRIFGLRDFMPNER